MTRTRYQDCAECCDQRLTKDMYPTMDGLICEDCVLDAFTESDFPQPTINDIAKQIIESGEAPWHR